MLYHAYEMSHAALRPARLLAELARAWMPPFGSGERPAAALAGMFLDSTARLPKPAFGLDTTEVDGRTVAVHEEVIHATPFVRILRFRRDLPSHRPADPKVLIVAPLSGHHATLLRGTVEAMLPGHDVAITDWIDAREIPLDAGDFTLDDYVDTLTSAVTAFTALGGLTSASGSPATAGKRLRGDKAGSKKAGSPERIALMAVCQPGVPVLVATALMAEDNDPARPSAVVLMGSPIDVALSPQAPNRLATRTPLSWFRQHAITRVPAPHPGAGRRVYPGFLQLSSFLAMNFDRHARSHAEQFGRLVRGDGDGAAAHRRFYEEYLAVMDLPASFYLDTIDRVFQRRLLARGLYRHGGRLVRPEAISDVALMTIEGEEDDITGLGQTAAAHRLTPTLPEPLHRTMTVADAGHYGIFNGRRWRTEIQPEVARFIRSAAG